MSPAGEVPERIRGLRASLGLSQAGLADLLGVSKLSIFRWEQGRARPTAASWRLFLQVESEGAAALDHLAENSEAALQTDWARADRSAYVPNNLPRPATSFIGRQRELAAIEAQLQHARLVTLTGPGGCGKTRLAIEVGHRLSERPVGTEPTPDPRRAPPAFPDGIWLVELDALRDRAHILTAVARTLAIPFEPMSTLQQRLTAALESKRLLLMIDNCEHLLSGCRSLVAELLAATTQLTILTTSREPLALTGEQQFAVLPLSLPRAGDRLQGIEDRALMPATRSADDFLSPETNAAGGALPLPPAVRGPRPRSESSEAVRLFVERARSAWPDFCLTPRNTPAVARICHRLDGLPLALELAAARVRLLSAEQIAARLDDRFRLLSRTDDEVPARQRSLRAAIDWSYTLLAAEEQRLFERLSVCAGSFALEAIEALVSEEELDGHFPLDVLGRLVEQSMVVVVQHAGQARYRMLESLRAYAQERLQASGERSAMRRRHADWYLTLARDCEPRLRGRQQVATLSLLDLEHENLRAALVFGAERGQSGDAAATTFGLQLAVALLRFWGLRGYLSEGRAVLQTLLAQAAAMPPNLRAAALDADGWLAFRQGDYSGARASLERGLSLAREAGSGQTEAIACYHLASLYRSEGDFAGAELAATEALERFQRSGDQWGMAACLNILGSVAQGRGRYETAWRLMQESLSLYRAVEDSQSIALLLTNLGVVANDAGDLETARELHEQSAARYRELGSVAGLARALYNLGQVALDRREHDHSARLHQQALDRFRDLANNEGIAMSLANLGHIARRGGEFGAARDYYRESLSVARATSSRQCLSWCLWGPGFLLVAEQDLERGARVLAAAERERAEIGYPLWRSAREDYEQSVAALHTGLSDERFDIAWSAGSALDLDAAIDEVFVKTEGRRLRTKSGRDSHEWGGDASLPLPASPLEVDSHARSAPEIVQSSEWSSVLSRRERDVLELLSQGLSNSQIAGRLVLSTRTVEHHIASIYAKLGVRTRAEAIALVLSHPPAVSSQP